MKLTAELSLYPLQEQYIPPIEDFIGDLRGRDGVQVVTNAMSTQLCGDCEAVFDLVSAALQASYARYGRQVLVCKFLPWELDLVP